jgi:hypothetical protein
MGLETIRQLSPKQFNWNTQNGMLDFGFIAEEVAAVNPLLATYDEKTGALQGVKYKVMSALLTRGLQQLDVQVQSNTSRISVLESGQFSGNLTVAGNGLFNGNLRVLGTTELASLQVTGNTEVANLTVNGKIITAGSAPTAVLGTTTTGQGSTHTIEGNDTAGSLTITTGTNSVQNPLAAGQQIAITFDDAFATTPRIALTAKDLASASVRHYVQTTTTGFTIHFIDAPTANTTYTFDYIIIQ